MASTDEWTLHGGKALILTASHTLHKPVVLFADPVAGATDLASFQAAADHTSYPLLKELERQGLDAILVGYDNGSASLKDLQQTATEAILRTVAEQLGDASLTVGGIGRGALLARLALAGMENDGVDHQTGTYFSYNGAAPASPEETAQLDRVGNWPMRPRLLKLVSADFTDKLSDNDFSGHTAGAANTEGALITKELGTWLLEQLVAY
ncbi:hypothetical protein [Streptomyces rubiginosohelvolus]|uniref:hypothetical protein n=1 Tax=Streptomyces rubiginosohelvolus TaxID=67362 RepID=UPI0035DCB2AB